MRPADSRHSVFYSGSVYKALLHLTAVLPVILCAFMSVHLAAACRRRRRRRSRRSSSSSSSKKFCQKWAIARPSAFLHLRSLLLPSCVVGIPKIMLPLSCNLGTRRRDGACSVRFEVRCRCCCRCQMSFFPIVQELHPRTVKGMRRAAGSAIIACFLLFAVLSLGSQVGCSTL